MNTQRIRILHLITDLDVGGAETMLYRLLSGMDRKRFDSRVVSMTGIGPVGEKISELGIPVRGLGMARGAPSPAALLRFWRHLQREKPQVLQSWMYHADLFGLAAGRLAGVPRIVWNIRCAYMDLNRYRGLTRQVIGICARLSGLPSAVIINSTAGRAHHATIGYHPRRWELMPNGFDVGVYRPRPEAGKTLREALGVREGAFLIGLVARFDPMKDHRNFLEAAALLRQQHPEAHFVLCGRGVDRTNARLRGWIDELGLESATHLLAERDDLATITAGLDVASLSSFGEGFPTVLGEAMACGVPCVTTDVGDAALIVGDTGIVVPPGDAEALASGWRRLIEMGSEGRQRLGMAARRRIEERYSLSAVVARYEALYEELAVGAEPRPSPGASSKTEVAS